MKRLRGNIRKAIESAQIEHGVYASALEDEVALRHSRAGSDIIEARTTYVVDTNEYGCELLEGCAGAANPSRLAEKVGLRAAEPCDIDLGWDLNSDEGGAQWRASIAQGKPLVVLAGIRCTPWCAFNKLIFSTNPSDCSK